MDNVISISYSIKDALKTLDRIGVFGNVLFVADDNTRLLGTVTDGDIRRGLLRDIDINSSVLDIANKKFRSAKEQENVAAIIKLCKKENIRYLPLIDSHDKLIKIIDVYQFAGFLPVNAVIMAGGKGQRLMPLTANIPKPMLNVGEKPIIEHNIDRLIKFGVQHISISINHLGEMISNYFQDGSQKGIHIDYISETIPLGTIGSIKLKNRYEKEYILVLNSDLLTNIDFEDFFNTFISRNADMAVASIPYHSDVPYAVLDLNTENEILAFQEKPRYTHHSNAGIYLFKRELIDFLPENTFFNATDLIQMLIDRKKKIVAYPILGYWLDIGRMNDYLKAQEDIKHLQL